MSLTTRDPVKGEINEEPRSRAARNALAIRFTATFRSASR
jgi:hypothetical protein